MSLKTPVYSVSQINRHVRSILEKDVGPVFIEGEISNLSKPASGHYYFSLKDTDAQIRCAFFKNRHQASLKTLEIGQQIIAGGVLSLYEARGEYQLIVEQIKDAGLGNLFQQFEKLKLKLQTEGLFAPERKKPIPSISDTIGVITSPTGAAIQDILSTLNRRFPLSKVLIYPCEVQGKNAHLQIIKALEKANLDQQCQVLILARGGGSIEDLWAFNQESLAYAIMNSKLPVVSGVGHETDFTIADFVADYRAATPTGAAESVTPNRQDFIATFNKLKINLNMAITRFISHQKLVLRHHQERLLSPEKYIQNLWQKLDFLTLNLAQHLKRDIGLSHQKLHLLKTRLHAHSPVLQLHQSQKELNHTKTSLHQAMKQIIANNRRKLDALNTTLKAVGPDATLARGYSIVTHHQSIIRDSQHVNINDELTIQLAKGKLITTVKETH